MITNNGHIICAIDTETTGLDPEVHAIWQVSAIPLTFNLDQDKTRPVLDLLMYPPQIDELPRAKLQLTSAQIEDVKERGLPPYKGADLFDDWFTKLNLPEGKRIIPLAFNWKFDMGHLQRWLGYSYTNYKFDGGARDAFLVAKFINDLAEFQGEPVPFARTNLGAVCKRLGVTLEHAHDATEDAFATVEVYKKLLRKVELC